MSEIIVGERVRMFSSSPVYGFGEIKTGDEGVVTHIDEDGYWVDFPEHSGWRGARGDLESLSPPPPTLETMLTEWRDLEARARAAQAEADALFEHAGQCHGEIVVRLAELGWGAPRGRVEPVVTMDTPEAYVALSDDWWKHVKVGDMLTYRVGDGKYHVRDDFTDGNTYRVHNLDRNDKSFPWTLYCDDGSTYYWGSPDYFIPLTPQ